MNVALHGLEEAAGVRYSKLGNNVAQTVPGTPALVRYADDLVALCHTRGQAEQVKARLAEWLAPRGLAFNEEKTQIVHVSVGFDFLGVNVRRYPNGKLLIMPSAKAVRRIRDRLSTEMRALRGSNAIAVIRKINPIVRGSPGVPSPSRDVAPDPPRRALATRPRGCSARSRCCSDASCRGTGCSVQHLWCDCLILTSR